VGIAPILTLSRSGWASRPTAESRADGNVGNHLASCYLCHEPCACLSPLYPRTSSLSTHFYFPYFRARLCVASRPSQLTSSPRPQLHTPSRDAAAPMLFPCCRIIILTLVTVLFVIRLSLLPRHHALLSFRRIALFASPSPRDPVSLKTRSLSVTFHSLSMFLFFYSPACACGPNSTLCSRSRMTICILRYPLLFISPDC